MTVVSTMLSRAEAYLAERRALGFALGRSGSLTMSFARFADAAGHEGALEPKIVLRWAKEAAMYADPFTWAKRVDVLRPFACWLADADVHTAFPPGKPFGCSYRRIAPHIYTEEEIVRLMVAAGRLPSGFGAGPATMPTLVGLLAATGLRISEALRLYWRDLDIEGGSLTIHHSKNQRSRLVPLHPTTVDALQRHRPKRLPHRSAPVRSPMFLDDRDGQALRYANVRAAWLRLRALTGIQPRGGHDHVRIHDLRHTFICRRLLLWQAQGVDIDNAMLVLSTYVGHASPVDTYWYMEAVPELMAVAGNRFEVTCGKEREACHA